jgi:hypothetical protein
VSAGWWLAVIICALIFAGSVIGIIGTILAWRTDNLEELTEADVAAHERPLGSVQILHRHERGDGGTVTRP